MYGVHTSEIAFLRTIYAKFVQVGSAAWPHQTMLAVVSPGHAPQLLEFVISRSLIIIVKDNNNAIFSGILAGVLMLLILFECGNIPGS